MPWEPLQKTRYSLFNFQQFHHRVPQFIYWIFSLHSYFRVLEAAISAHYSLTFAQRPGSSCRANCVPRRVSSRASQFNTSSTTSENMFRIPSRTLRTFGPSLKRAPVGVRFSSTQTSTSSNARYVWASAAVIGTGTGVYLFSGKGAAKTLTNEVPNLKEFSSENQIPTNSPVKELIMEDADAKLREDAHTFVFDGNGGVRGRVDFARLGSNNPMEDEWDLKIAKGVGGTNTLYAGVYDGHA